MNDEAAANSSTAMNDPATASITAAARRHVVGALVRSAREQACRKPREMAEFLGIATSAMNAIENGERDVPLPLLEAIAFYLHVPVHMLLGIAALPVAAEPPPDLNAILRLRSHIIGARIRQARMTRAESEADCAAALGVPRATLTAWEIGRRQPGIAELERILAHYGMVWDDLLDLGIGPLGELQMAQAQRAQFEALPAELRALICDPHSQPLLQLAARLHRMPRHELRAIASALGTLADELDASERTGDGPLGNDDE
jgi:transcriptional regulator with XRE-family HTH domain